jgi:hypothetical protein
MNTDKDELRIHSPPMNADRAHVIPARHLREDPMRVAQIPQHAMESVQPAQRFFPSSPDVEFHSMLFAAIPRG